MNHIHRLAISTGRVLEQAEYFYNMGDEEQAFIFFMKYFNLLHIIQKMPDFETKIKGRQREFFGVKGKVMEQMDKLEKLKASLTKR